VFPDLILLIFQLLLAGVRRSAMNSSNQIYKKKGRTSTRADLCDSQEGSQIRDHHINLCRFCCVYPGIRHEGKPAGGRRGFVPLGPTLICLLILGLAG
jgi:hypothetical protein